MDLDLGSGFESQLDHDRSAVCPSPVNIVFGVRVLMYSCSFSASNTHLTIEACSWTLIQPCYLATINRK
jgi:hypothetical protein